MSRPRNAARAAARRDLIRPLLRDGAQFVSPAPELVRTAEWLAGLGVVELRRGTVVRCAHPEDVDYPPPSRHCEGLIELRAGADEGGGDCRCPVCERQVFPEALSKRQFDALCVGLCQAGIEALLIDRLGDLTAGGTFVDGVLTVPLIPFPGFVCLVDWCSDERRLGRTAAAQLPIVYVTAGPDLAPRMLDDQAIAHVELADILAGSKDLRVLLVERPARISGVVGNVDIPVYTLGSTPILPKSDAQRERRIFHLRLSPAGLLVNDVLAIRTPRRNMALAIMHKLMKAFAEAAVAGRSVAAMTADALADAVQASDQEADEEEEGEVIDADTIARSIRRLRKDIIQAVRSRKGDPIGEHDVIETVSRSGAGRKAEGYRLNPRSVALGPLEP